MINTRPIADDLIEYEASPERRLMLAVLLTAVLDASGRTIGTKRSEQPIVRGTAFGWIKDAGADFREVCELAGIEPELARKQALAFIADADISINGKRFARTPRDYKRSQPHE